MCLAIVGKILSINNDDAMVIIMGIKTTVNIILIEDLHIGDEVLIHAGFAIEKISEEKADFIKHQLKALIMDDKDG